MSPRAGVAALVVAVGSTLWLWLPGPAVQDGGPLQDASAGGRRWHVHPGRALVAWVIVTNTSTRSVKLSSAHMGPGLRGHARLLGTAARAGRVATIGDTWPSRDRAFREVDGFDVAAGGSATIAFGLAAPGPVRLSLGGVEVRYRSNGTDYRRAIAATTTVCVTRLSHCRRR